MKYNVTWKNKIDYVNKNVLEHHIVVPLTIQCNYTKLMSFSAFGSLDRSKLNEPCNGDGFRRK